MDNIELTDPSPSLPGATSANEKRCGKVPERVARESGPAFRVPFVSARSGLRGISIMMDVSISRSTATTGPAVILRNQGGTGNHWLLINLVAR